MRIRIVLLLFFGSIGWMNAQQGPQFSLSPMDPFFANPAFAGMDNTLKVNGAYRAQWVGIPGAPVSQILNAHSPLYFAGGGVGFQLINEQLGAEQQLSATLSYNYQIFLNRRTVLSIGLSGGLQQYTLDGSILRTPDGVYEGNIIDHIDGQLPSGRVSQVAPVFHSGAWLRADRFEAGIGVRNLAATNIDAGNLSFTTNREYTAQLRYSFDMGRAVVLRPSVWLRSDFNQTQIDFNILAQVNDNIFGGVSLRGYDANSLDALIFQAGLRLNEKITLAYAYDLTLSALREVSDGSHEVMIQYDFGTAPGKGRLPAIIYHPRMK